VESRKIERRREKRRIKRSDVVRRSVGKRRRETDLLESLRGRRRVSRSTVVCEREKRTGDQLELLQTRTMEKK